MKEVEKNILQTMRREGGREGGEREREREREREGGGGGGGGKHAHFGLGFNFWKVHANPIKLRFTV